MFYDVLFRIFAYIYEFTFIMELGLYEQIITKMFEYKLKQMDNQNYYIGTKQIDKSNVAS